MLKNILFKCLLLFFVFHYSTGQVMNEFSIENISIKNVIRKPDSLFTAFDKTKREKLQQGDTLAAINILIKVARAHTNKGNFAKSYKDYWEALFYSKKIKDSVYVTNTYRGLGLLYSLFGRNKDAEEYFNNAIDVIKNKANPTRKELIDLGNSYYSFSGHHRDNGNYGVAQQYLDSCSVIKNKINQSSIYFLNSAQAYIYSKMGRQDEALRLLIPLETIFKTKRPSYLIILYSFLGEIYAKKNEYNKSELYYLKALEYLEQYKTHQNYIPKLYQQLAELYFKMGKLAEAYENLKTSKEVSENFFGVKSDNNIEIIEIEDSYRKERNIQLQKLEKARLETLEAKQRNLFLQNVILLISVISIILFSLVVVRNLKKKRKADRNQFETEQKLTAEKNTEVLDFKNKELTSSALQLIQKDELINDIKNVLTSSDKIEGRQINQILTKIKMNKGYDWKEFNARFASVNESFYATLKEKYPKLTQRDHRLCALIKLNFTSKEIAQLLGISVDSVNTSRYRLRKKMSLTKEQDLSEIILGI